MKFDWKGKDEMSGKSLTASSFCRFGMSALLVISAAIAVVQLTADQAYAETRISLDVTRAGPRSVERLTDQGVARNYGNAWDSLSHALQSNDSDSLAVSFVGPAKEWLTATVTSQQGSGLTRRYLNQSHNLEAIFYAPEGDVIELHDTARYREQVWDGSKLIQDQPVMVRYIVLMTPSADRWVIRYLQAVPQF
jgi:hypothetical protein